MFYKQNFALSPNMLFRKNKSIMKGVPPELWLLKMNKMSLILRIQEIKRSTFSILLRKKLGYVFFREYSK